MGAVVLGRAESEAARITRNLPAAHARWEFWKKNNFRNAVHAFVDLVESVEQDWLDDHICDALATLIERVIRVIGVEAATLRRDDARDSETLDEYATVTSRLHDAAESLRAGLAPDPAKRPTQDQMFDELSALLSDGGFNLRGHKGCA